MRNFVFTLLGLLVSCCLSAQNRTLVAYYSYTGNVKAITNELKNLISADFVEILPAEEGVKYEANNYAIGSALISAIRNNPDNADSYPEIKSIDIEFSQYDNIIIATPLWWSNMAAPMQTFLFNNGGEMNGKNISLIVSSASSSIQSVVDDAKRLIPDGNFSDESLWINNSNRSNMPTLLENWIKATKISDDMANKIYITIGDTTLTATLIHNRSSQALLTKLKEASFTYQAHDYNHFEKVGSLGQTFPTDDVQTTTESGDIVLYNGNQIVIFYGSNSWSYTRLGKIDDITADELKRILGDGDNVITLSLDKPGTSVNTIKISNISNSSMYDLQGRQIKSPQKGQIYIQNGEKWMSLPHVCKPMVIR